VGFSDDYRNPWGTIPSPPPAKADIPTPFWGTQRIPVNWNGGTPNIGVWGSPVFDLRPDLRSMPGDAKTGVPMWNRSARLYIQISGLTSAAGNTEDLFLTYAEFASVSEAKFYNAAPPRAVADPGFPNQTSSNSVRRVTSRVDITSEISLGVNQPNAVIITFVPIGEGYPVRYWAIQLTFNKTDGTSPNLHVQAAMY
jgi:hypothetical protein